MNTIWKRRMKKKGIAENIPFIFNKIRNKKQKNKKSRREKVNKRKIETNLIKEAEIGNRRKKKI